MVHDLRALHKWGIWELKYDYAHVVHGPIKRTQGIV